MSIFEQTRYFFNNILPNLIISNLKSIDLFLSQYWWVFAIFTVTLLFLNLKLFRIGLMHKNYMQSFNIFLEKLGSQRDLKEVQTKLLQFSKLLNAKHSALYELKGETYILIQSSVMPEHGKINIHIPFRVKGSDLKNFTKSGNFMIEYFTSLNRIYMILFFSHQKITIEDYRGFIDSALNFYAILANNNKIKNRESISSEGKDISISLVKLQIDKYQFLKFLVFLVLKITHAKGVRLLSKEDKVKFENISDEKASLQKVFYIRNTPYKLEFYNVKPLTPEILHQIGSFLDMMGAFLVNIDKNSEMIQNYLKLLRFTNNAIELENTHYQNHSLIVSIVATEVAKSLFLSEEEIDNITLGASLHDIGMLGDLSKILGENKLDTKALDSIKEHPIIGSIMVEPIAHIYPIANMLKYHHERFDGMGYPFGLKGSQIPIGAQAVALGEFYAGITGDREYRKGKSHEEAVQEIQDMKNKMFDPVLVDAFLDIQKNINIKIQKIQQEKEDNS